VESMSVLAPRASVRKYACAETSRSPTHPCQTRSANELMKAFASRTLATYRIDRNRVRHDGGQKQSPVWRINGESIHDIAQPQVSHS
jgi:hypothetical protein